MNEKFSPSKRVPLKSYAHYEDAPRGEWFLISNAERGLYGYRWHKAGGINDMYFSRRVIDSRDDYAFNGVPVLDIHLFADIARFLSGKFGPDDVEEPCDEFGNVFAWSYKDIPESTDYEAIGALADWMFCYRDSKGVFFDAEMGEPPESDKIPIFYYEEFEDVVRFLAGKDGLTPPAEGEGGLTR